MKREPYVITENMEPEEIKAMIDRAYNEGYQDGMSVGTLTVPTYPMYPQPQKNYCDKPWWDNIEITCKDKETITK